MRAFLSRAFPPLPLVFPSIASGVLVTLCFPVVSAWWLCFVALVPILVAFVRHAPGRRDAYKAGFLMGVSCYLTMLWWIVKLIPSADVTVPWLMTPALIVLVLYLSLYPAFFLLLLAVVTRHRRAAVVFVAPALWTLLELARSVGELAFPWGVLGNALTEVPELIQTASTWGAPGLSFAIVLVNALLLVAVGPGRARSRVAAVAGAVVIVGALYAQGRSVIATYDAKEKKPGVEVAVVQPNVDLAVKWKPEFRDSTLRLIQRLTMESADRGAEVVFFPETSAPVYIENNRRFRSRLQTLARDAGAPFFIGFLDHREDGPGGDTNVYNSSGLFTPDGGLVKYEKSHLLPFGEALPLAWKFRWLRNVNFGQANFQPGDGGEPIDAGPVSFTPLICFESVFSYLCRRGVRDGSELFVNITNDGWFSDTPGPSQHAHLCILRSVEYRRYLVRSANTGISWVVDPMGRVVERLGLFEHGMIVREVVPRHGLTPYANHGDTPVLVTCLVLVLVGAWVSRRRSRDEFA